MQSEDPQPLHPRTVAAMRQSEGSGYMKMLHSTDQAFAEIIRVMKTWPPERLSYLLELYTSVYDNADPEDYPTRTMAGLATIKLGELLATWHGEVRDGLHDKKKDTDAGDDAG